ncbi:phage integrase SAM-like domain-containing protein [Chryseobacterium wangxinyae]|uniref:phage integrase SAM-like domain-containing protein n=1 Tax=Chryseobacterium sp. CY353 TaxID=2997334 RepID=UPI00226E831C|nr:phage integrase SAM-like domain-containing protein [Chryseobacterium sp. CY353]MCY0970261.1 phage integrase SAM-like domain-containing protein [Chryseobacterium sp. CY353]
MSVKFYIRKNTGEAKVNLRYRPNRETNIVLTTPFSIQAEHWDPENECYRESLRKRSPKNEIDKLLNKNLDALNLKLNEFKVSLNGFILSNNYQIDSDKIKGFIAKNYGGAPIKKTLKSTVSPLLISELIEKYIEEKSVFSLGKHKPITNASISKFRVIKGKINKISPNLAVKDINDSFRDKFTRWCGEKKYSEVTIVKELKIIKTFIKFGKSLKYKVSDDVANWSFYITPKSYKHPVLTFEELRKIETVSLPYDYLENARDWLLIGCFTGQRVSDLLNFDHTKIVQEDFLTFTQKKTNDEITIFLIPKVKEILAKRNGQFPRKISDQKFNDYIKIVCQLAELDEILVGGKMVGNRKVVDTYEKWELISSHICRRSFVTNFRHILGDEGIMTNTGHKTQAMVELYDQNTQLEKARKHKDLILKKLELLEI